MLGHARGRMLGRVRRIGAGLVTGVLVPGVLVAGALVAGALVAGAPVAAGAALAVPAAPVSAQQPDAGRPAGPRVRVAAWSAVQTVNSAVATHQPYSSYGHPLLAASADGQRAAIAWQRARAEWIAMSSDAGATWRAPVVIPSPEECLFDQGERLAASADGRHLVLLWRCQVPGSDHTILASASDDAGATWSPIAVLAEYAQLLDVDELQLSLSADGSTATAAWVQQNGNGSIQLARSVDGGRSWASPTGVVTSGGNDYVRSLSSVASADGSQITLAWTLSLFGGATRTVAMSSADGGGTWTPATAIPRADTYSVRLSATPDGRRVAAIWSTQASSATIEDDAVLVALSPDGGVTWADPVELARGGELSEPRIATCNRGTALVAVWMRTRGTRERAGLLATSRDGGRTWSKPMTLANGPVEALPVEAGCSSDSGGMAVAWSGRVTGEWRAQVRTSTNAGRRWSAPALLSPRGGDAEWPQVVVSATGARRLVAWSFATGTRSAVQAVHSPAT